MIWSSRRSSRSRLSIWNHIPKWTSSTGACVTSRRKLPMRGSTGFGGEKTNPGCPKRPAAAKKFWPPSSARTSWWLTLLWSEEELLMRSDCLMTGFRRRRTGTTGCAARPRECVFSSKTCPEQWRSSDGTLRVPATTGGGCMYRCYRSGKRSKEWRVTSRCYLWTASTW